MIPIITIDGPSGVGKGTLGQYLCTQTGFHMLDSGAIYRSLAYATIVEKADLEAVETLVELAKALEVAFKDGNIFYQGQDITSKVRTEEVALVASKIAANQSVRDALLIRQKNFAQMPGLIADGRDMGTTVFPDARVKLFLTASAEQRAERRVKQLKNQGIDANIIKITQDIKERDERDRTRAASPLIPAADAILVDTTSMSIDDVCQFSIDKIQQAGVKF